MRIIEISGLIHSAKSVVIRKCVKEGINPLLFSGSGNNALNYVLDNPDLKIYYDTITNKKDYDLYLDSNNTLHIGIM